MISTLIILLVIGSFAAVVVALFGLLGEILSLILEVISDFIDDIINWYTHDRRTLYRWRWQLHWRWSDWWVRRHRIRRRWWNSTSQTKIKTRRPYCEHMHHSCNSANFDSICHIFFLKRSSLQFNWVSLTLAFHRFRDWINNSQVKKYAKCGYVHHKWKSYRNQWECKQCGHRTGLKAGTLMHSSKLPLMTWFIAIHLKSHTSQVVEPKIISKILQWVHSVISNAKSLLLDIHHDIQHSSFRVILMNFATNSIVGN